MVTVEITRGVFWRARNYALIWQTMHDRGIDSISGVPAELPSGAAKLGGIVPGVTEWRAAGDARVVVYVRPEHVERVRALLEALERSS